LKPRHEAKGEEGGSDAEEKDGEKEGTEGDNSGSVR
jgi:hypothetical protein